jgi:hypothetical protein
MNNKKVALETKIEFNIRWWIHKVNDKIVDRK